MNNYRNKTYNIKAVLRNYNFANYYDYFHNNSLEDYFYKIIVKETNILQNNLNNLNNLNETIELKVPNKEGFYFKTDNTIYCLKNGVICSPEDIIDCNVLINLVIYNYDFVKNSTKIIGVGIKAKKIKVI
jgi:hypothetical protein